MSNQTSIKQSFTFIETLVVISVLALAFPIVFSILFVILQQQVKIFRLTEVKRQGDQIVRTMENVFNNNAYRIFTGGSLSGNWTGGTLICDPTNLAGGNITYFEDQYNNQFWFNNAGGILNLSTFNAPAPAPALPFQSGDLTNNKVVVSSPFVLSCDRSSIFSAPLISLNFTVCFNNTPSSPQCPYAGPLARPEEQASLPYQTAIKLENFSTLLPTPTPF